jgi:hypothetical protein
MAFIKIVYWLARKPKVNKVIPYAGMYIPPVRRERTIGSDVTVYLFMILVLFILYCIMMGFDLTAEQKHVASVFFVVIVVMYISVSSREAGGNSALQWVPVVVIALIASLFVPMFREAIEYAMSPGPMREPAPTSWWQGAPKQHTTNVIKSR